MSSTVAGAPRPARDQSNGRSPGSRVRATCRLPELSFLRHKSVASGKYSPLTVAGAAVGLYRRATRETYHIPSSLSRLERPSRAAVQRCAVALSMAARRFRGAAQNGSTVDLLSLPARCITLKPLSGARVQLCFRLASETGIRCECRSGASFRDCPRNGKRIKTKLKSLRPEREWEDLRPPQGVCESGDRPGIE